ncbi:MAG: polyprenyl synthetase family protein [Armatimonadota bacterium]|nr:polyprenyl synthetase family protein [Armatimonadota bacterium]MDR7533335.1 polyprenyl synthetase family protein [Armatimonadota bacterium]MDR7536455.1 polyprenyl synthetase family protein [Armatimonadota bacterium]
MALDLQEIYRPVADDLEGLYDLLRRELRTDDPFIGELVEHVLASRGKLVRPALALLSAAAAGGADEQRLWLAGAVELIHIASLVHDDVIDASDLRRGVSTVNVLWGNQIAVLLGDYLFATAFDLVSRIRHPQVAPTIARAAVAMSEAEILATKVGGEPYDDDAVYFRIIEGKTARLFAAACRAGGLVAGATPAVADALEAFGLAWGMCFQITDDALDLVGDPEAMGKPIGSDIDTGKTTLPVIAALREAPPADRDRLRALVRGGAGGLAELQALVDRYGGVRRALHVAQAYADRAVTALHPLPPGPARASLQALASFVLMRAR